MEIHNMLDHALSNKLVDLLMRIPLTETYSGRSSLLQGLPPVSLQRSEGNCRLDLLQIVQQIDQLGRLRSNGIRPLLVVASNGLASIQSWEGELTGAFEDVMHELSSYYGGEPSQPLEMEPQPERLLFRISIGSVGQDFFERAVGVARGVARLMLPRVLHGITVSTAAFGTGWLIAPGLLITNYHVVEVRDVDEAPATYEDMCAQVKDALVWFDFFKEQQRPLVECRGAELVAFSKSLDYALIRLKENQRITDRKPLTIIPTKPALKPGYHLNIVQHPQGGPLRYAIRNNYYVQSHPTKEHVLHYLTDTEQGSSGSPVLNDVWCVLALHHAATPIAPHTYDMQMQGLSQKEIVNYYNEGIALYQIMADLPESIRQEIQRGQQASRLFSL
jgi:endonuclease G, mitochondrial